MGNLSVSNLQETVGLYTFVLNELLVCLTYIGRNDDPNLPLKLSTVYFEILKALFFVQSVKFYSLKVCICTQTIHGMVYRAVHLLLKTQAQ